MWNNTLLHYHWLKMHVSGGLFLIELSSRSLPYDFCSRFFIIGIRYRTAEFPLLNRWWWSMVGWCRMPSLMKSHLYQWYIRCRWLSVIWSFWRVTFMLHGLFIWAMVTIASIKNNLDSKDRLRLIIRSKLKTPKRLDWILLMEGRYI